MCNWCKACAEIHAADAKRRKTDKRCRARGKCITISYCRLWKRAKSCDRFKAIFAPISWSTSFKISWKEKHQHLKCKPSHISFNSQLKLKPLKHLAVPKSHNIPVIPAGHTHRNPPFVLTQRAPFLHGLRAHSSISVDKRRSISECTVKKNGII